MTIQFDPVIKRKQAITYNDDTVMQSQNENEMLTFINEYHSLLRKANLKAGPDITFFFFWKKKQIFRSQFFLRSNPALRIDLKDLKSPESKQDVMKALG